MLRIATNTIKQRTNGNTEKTYTPVLETDVPRVLPPNAKLLAWGIFLFYFIENGTLGLIPKELYFVYRNMRISDFLLYGLTIYSLWNASEFRDLYSSRALTIVKMMLVYLLAQFFVSCISYEYNVLEYFFRLKSIWTSFLVFPFLLLLQRKGLPYLIKLILPVAIVSNVLYILSAISGVAFLPEIGIVKQSLPGGLEVYRVYGGTFFGDYFFLGFIYIWLTDKFKPYQLILVVLFVMPQILAFGRQAWVYYTLTLFLMFVWSSMRKKEFRMVFRQVALFAVLGASLIYVFVTYIPRSDYLTEAIGARIEQGQSDVNNNEGTYGTRVNSVNVLVGLWLNNNMLFGVGMHPMWVVTPVTEEERAYAWGFSDVGWAAILAAYGIIGFSMAMFFQIYFGIITFKILKRTKKNDIYTFFVLMFFAKLIFDSVLNYSTQFFSTGLTGFGGATLYIAAMTYKYERLNE